MITSIQLQEKTFAINVLSTKVWEWLEDQSIRHRKKETTWIRNDKYHKIYIYDEADAALFKLTWV